MSDTPAYNPPPKKNRSTIWLGAIGGLLLLDVAIDLFRRKEVHDVEWAVCGAGILLILLSLWQATRK